MEPGPDSRDDNVNGSDTILVISKFVIQAARKNYKDEFTVLDIFVKSNWKDEFKTLKTYKNVTLLILFTNNLNHVQAFFVNYTFK